MLIQPRVAVLNTKKMFPVSESEHVSVTILLLRGFRIDPAVVKVYVCVDTMSSVWSQSTNTGPSRIIST